MKRFRYLSLAALLPSLSSHALEVDGRDLAVENGPKEDFRMNLRYVRFF